MGYFFILVDHFKPISCVAKSYFFTFVWPLNPVLFEVPVVSGNWICWSLFLEQRIFRETFLNSVGWWRCCLRLIDFTLKGRDTPSRLQRTSGDESRRCCRLTSAASDQKAALEHTAQTTTDGKLTCAFCACVRGVNCLYQQLSIVYIRHSKGETETKIYKINADIRNVNKAALAYHFEDNFNQFKQLMLLWRHSRIRMIGKDHVG